MLDMKFMGKHRLEMTAFGYGSCMSFGGKALPQALLQFVFFSF